MATASPKITKLPSKGAIDSHRFASESGAVAVTVTIKDMATAADLQQAAVLCEVLRTNLARLAMAQPARLFE